LLELLQDLSLSHGAIAGYHESTHQGQGLEVVAVYSAMRLEHIRSTSKKGMEWAEFCNVFLTKGKSPAKQVRAWAEVWQLWA
jgi:hypothetical protein